MIIGHDFVLNSAVERKGVTMAQEILDRLESFVLATDYITEEIDNLIESMFARYIEGWGHVNYEVLIYEKLRYGGGELVPTWRSYKTKGKSIPIPATRGDTYNGHAEYCFCEEKDAWVTAKGGGLLKDVNDTINFLDAYGNQDLPRYRAYENEHSRTSIVKTVRSSGEIDSEVIGLLTIETPDVLQRTPRAMKAVEKMATIISIVERVRRATDFNTHNTRRVANELLKNVQQEKMLENLFAKPMLFQAHGARASSDVLDIVNDAVEKIDFRLRNLKEPGLDHRVWKNEVDPENIIDTIFGNLLNATAGIAYFSEPSDQGLTQFVDNPNVLYEAGIMACLTQQNDTRFRGWVSIREQRSPQFPFDIASKRTVLIERDESGKILNSATAGDKIRKMLETIFLPLTSGSSQKS